MCHRVEHRNLGIAVAHVSRRFQSGLGPRQSLKKYAQKARRSTSLICLKRGQRSLTCRSRLDDSSSGGSDCSIHLSHSGSQGSSPSSSAFLMAIGVGGAALVSGLVSGAGSDCESGDWTCDCPPDCHCPPHPADKPIAAQITIEITLDMVTNPALYIRCTLCFDHARSQRNLFLRRGLSPTLFVDCANLRAGCDYEFCANIPSWSTLTA